MTELVKGHSGSLVVDADTGEAYGYIVALDVFGKAQVVPLYSAFEQIRTLMSAKDVVLAEPVLIEINPGCTTTITKDAYRVSNSFRSSEDDKNPSEWLAERKEPLRHHRSDNASFQLPPTPLQSSAYPIEESPQFRHKASSHELPSFANKHKHQKVEKIFTGPRQETDAKHVGVLQKDSHRIVERLHNIRRGLQKERCQIDGSDLEFLLDLTNSMHDQFSTHSHKDQRRLNRPLGSGVRYEQTDTSTDSEFRIMDTNDTKRREVSLIQDSKEHHEHVVKLLSMGEQHPVHETETTSAEQHACEGVREQTIVDFGEFPKLHMIPGLPYDESDNEQANLFSYSDEKYRDDTTSITSLNHSPAFPIPGSSDTNSTIEILTKPEPKSEARLSLTCPGCGKNFTGEEPHIHGRMRHHLRQARCPGRRRPPYEICERTLPRYDNREMHMSPVHRKDHLERAHNPPKSPDEEDRPNAQ